MFGIGNGEKRVESAGGGAFGAETELPQIGERYPRKSQYGAELKIVAEGFAIPLDQIQFREVGSTLKISDESQAKIRSAFEAAQKSNPHFFDGMLWRTESVNLQDGQLRLSVSPTRYSAHNILRKEQREATQYPNPITINTLQRTKDGFLLLGVRGSVADQTGIDLIGAGFIARSERQDGSNKLPSLRDAVINECYGGSFDRKKGETDYLGVTDVRNAFDPEALIAFAVLSGMNKDSTIAILNQLHVPLSSVSLPSPEVNQEHARLIPVKDDEPTLARLLHDKAIEGVPVSDITLGVIETYLKAKQSGLIKN